jgi:DNA (cytosine-5)-methyltransferase 1
MWGATVTEIDILDLFCGCGGASTGFQTAKVPNGRYRVIGGVDIDPHALATFHRNLKAPAISFDLSKVRTTSDVKELLSHTTRNYDNPLFLVGCAPCQAFSSHTKNKAKPDSRRNLLPALARIAKLLNPDAILIENVPELLADRNWKYFKGAKRALESSGYLVRAQIYNFAEFGLPQERFRAVVMAFKAPFVLPKPFLRPQQFSTVRQTIAGLPLLRAGEVPSEDPMHITSKHRASTLAILRISMSP